MKNYYTKSGFEILASIYLGPCLPWKQEVVILRLGKVKFNKTFVKQFSFSISLDGHPNGGSCAKAAN